MALPGRQSSTPPNADDRLIEAKALLPHGDWIPWLEANTEVIPRQSQKYMRLAEQLGGDCQKRTGRYAFEYQHRPGIDCRSQAEAAAKAAMHLSR